MRPRLLSLSSALSDFFRGGSQGGGAKIETANNQDRKNRERADTVGEVDAADVMDAMTRMARTHLFMLRPVFNAILFNSSLGLFIQWDGKTSKIQFIAAYDVCNKIKHCP